VLGIGVVANGQHASLKLAEKRKKDNLLEAKRKQKLKHKLHGGPVVTFRLPEGGNFPHTTRQLRHCNKHFKY